MAKFVKKAVDSSKGKQAASAPDDKGFAKDRPAMWEYMTLRKHEDGKERETLTFTVFVEGDQWKAVANDRDNKRTAFVSADTFTGVLDALERGLSEDDMEWRQYDPAKGKFRKG